MDDGSDQTGAAPDPDERAAAGVDHLQAAGREFVAAARSLLDAVEAVVEDRSRLGDLAESFTGFVGELIDTARGGDRTPWGPAVRFEESATSDADRGAGRTGGDRTDGHRDDAHRDDAHRDDAHRDDAASGQSETAEPPAEPESDPPRTGRVRRIPVD